MNIEEILKQIHQGNPRAIARAITLIEENDSEAITILSGLKRERLEKVLVIGITGPPGAGKSTLTNSLIRQFRKKGVRIGVVAVDPSSPISGGALLGDRIRMMDHALDRDVVLRSMATRGRLGGLCASAGSVVRIMAASNCQVVIIETVGTGQSEIDIIRMADLSVMVLAPGFGDDIQAMKAGILEVADLLVINKADKPGAETLMHDLGSWFDRDNGSESKIIQTIASENKGTELLIEQIYAMADTYQNNGLWQQKREKSLAFETIDWALEILRESLEKKVATMSGKIEEPREAAPQLIAHLLAEKRE